MSDLVCCLCDGEYYSDKLLLLCQSVSDWFSDVIVRKIKMEQQILHIEGTVENVLFKNESNGYIVLDLDAGGELITVVGELGDIEDGEGLILEGNYITHPDRKSVV